MGVDGDYLAGDGLDEWTRQQEDALGDSPPGAEATLAGVQALIDRIADLERQLAASRERPINVAILAPDPEHVRYTSHSVVLRPGVQHRMTVNALQTNLTTGAHEYVQVDLGVQLI